MSAWFIEVLNPFAGPIGGSSPRCIAAAIAVAGYAVWRQRRNQTPAGVTGAEPAADRSGDRPLVGSSGDDG